MTEKEKMLFGIEKLNIKRSEIGRKMTEKESVIFLFWEGDFEYEEKFYIDEDEMREFKNKTLKTR